MYLQFAVLFIFGSMSNKGQENKQHSQDTMKFVEFRVVKIDQTKTITPGYQIRASFFSERCSYLTKCSYLIPKSTSNEIILNICITG